ncbi:energy-coupling factor transporter transmembrane protein EcfT [Brachybacterium sp. EF45031]|uniref:energy-coupling factor transporter transmembrane component T family protein n=1 Tax=Brachybacterium sillae TaxID=2810536 RepID=UPI00217E3636|nr:energy-coupling factor transporter transmembrane component T [Brachybacterium sillae]MCS6711430.1 energy-coupling factor transporter transmembrane protein EcfT [Brachybacterium sillae]
MSGSVLGYVDRPGALHRLSGVSKLVLVIGVVIGGMLTFDLRYLLALCVLSAVLWVVSRVRLRDLAVVLGFIAVFMTLNNLLIYVFAPQYGAELFGSRTVLVGLPGRWALTAEQLWYQASVTAKYVAILPSVLLFIATTRPPEFASSLHRLGVPYRIAYAVSLALRYIPEVQQEFLIISRAQQARGRDLSRAAPLRERIRNAVGVLVPLLLGTFERIETVATAMELRGFGSGRGRTWYARRPLRVADGFVIALGVLIAVVGALMVVIDGGRFWNVFAA